MTTFHCWANHMFQPKRRSLSEIIPRGKKKNYSRNSPISQNFLVCHHHDIPNLANCQCFFWRDLSLAMRQDWLVV